MDAIIGCFSCGRACLSFCEIGRACLLFCEIGGACLSFCELGGACFSILCRNFDIPPRKLPDLRLFSHFCHTQSHAFIIRFHSTLILVSHSTFPVRPQAHLHGRKADHHLRHLRFDDAIESHRKAAASLEETLQSSANINDKIVESIRLQIHFHSKHIELVRLKKVHHEKTQSVELQRYKHCDLLEQRASKERLVDVCDLQIAIFKALESTDGLLETLSARRDQPPALDAPRADEPSANGFAAGTDDEKASSLESGAAVDEMRRLNGQIHALVYNLVQRVDESTQETEALRDRIKALEKDRSPRQASLNASKSSYESIRTDESPTLSDGNETRRSSVSGEERKIVLPESSDLPPLELPEFDYDI